MEKTPSLEGLSSWEASRLLKKYGFNAISGKKEKSRLVEFLLKFRNPLVFLLVFASIVSIFLGQIVSAVMIMIMIFLSTVLDFFNTYKSEKAVEKLKNRVRVTASVWRDGQLKEIPVNHLVPGDVIYLSPGDVVPADGKIVFAKNFFVDESSLTGESFPMAKNEGRNVFMGGNVVAGEAEVEIRETGNRTKFSQIAESLSHRDEPTNFDKGIKDFSYLILKIIFVLVILIFLVNSLFRHGAFDSFLFAVALAVGLTPELLPMVMTLNLARGSLNMSRHGVIVKKLAAIQNFGSMDILCADKTGTLTEDKITLVKYVDGNGKNSDWVLFFAFLSSFYHAGIKNPLDKALKEFRHLDVSGYERKDEIPFDSFRRRDSVVVREKGKRKRFLLVTKGAPEEILKISSFYNGKKKETISDADIKKFQKTYHNLSREGFRVLGVAMRTLSKKEGSYSQEEEYAMTFLGFVAFFDPPKETAKETLKMMQRYGIEIKIITGDNELVTERVAKDLQLAVKGMLTGLEISEISDSTLALRAEQTTIFSRVSPDQKLRVIRALRSRGHVVGYLGDGINDAPSIKAADVGISVDNAADVSKETADLILLRKNLRELIEGVVEGRRTFANTSKYLMISLSSNFGNMFSMALASFFLPFLPMLPVQILLNNLLYDASQSALPLDSVDDREVEKPKKWNMDLIKKFMILFGPLSSIFDLLSFGIFLYVLNFGADAFRTGWFLESVMTQVLVVHVIRTKKIPFLESMASRPLLVGTFLAVGLSWFLVFNSGIGKLFGFVSLNLTGSVWIFGIAFVYFLAVEFAKRKFFLAIKYRL